MTNLVITIICIALAVVVASMGAIYVNPAVFKAKEYRHEIEAGFAKLKVGYDLYLMYNGEKSDPTGAWQDQLNSVRGPAIGGNTVPSSVQGGFDWSYNNVGNRYYFCISGDYNKSAMMGFVRAQSNIKSDYIYINSACAATTDNTSITTGTIAMTCWLSK